MTRVACCVATALALTALAPRVGHAERATPSWAEYHGERETSLAWRALAEGRPARAQAHADRATELLPEALTGWAVSTRAAMGRGDWPAAYDAVTALRKLAPDDAQGLDLLGRVAVELGQGAQARQAFEALRGLEPDLVAPQLGLALVSARVDKDVPRAIGELRAAQALSDNLDLAVLLLQPSWTVLAQDEAFVEALNALLAAQNENGPPAR